MGVAGGGVGDGARGLVVDAVERGDEGAAAAPFAGVAGGEVLVDELEGLTGGLLIARGEVSDGVEDGLEDRGGGCHGPRRRR